MRSKEIRPALPARIAAWGIAFLLTVTLTITALGGPAAANRIFTDETLHIRIATDESVIREQMDKVSGEIRELAEDYSFSAEAVIGALPRTAFEELNKDTARWWTRIVAEGVMGEIPSWTAGEQITEAIASSLDMDKIPEEEQSETVRGIAVAIEKAVNRTVMPFRKALVTLAVRYTSRKADIPGMIRFAAQVPLTALVLSILLAGLIALLLGKRIRWSLKYYGASFAGAGISSLTGIVLIRNADISGMIRAASQGLDHQVRSMMSNVVTETWLAASALFLLGMTCLICYIREPACHGKHGGEHETKKNDSPDPVAENTGTAPDCRRRRSAQRSV